MCSQSINLHNKTQENEVSSRPIHLFVINMPQSIYKWGWLGRSRFEWETPASFPVKLPTIAAILWHLSHAVGHLDTWTQAQECVMADCCQVNKITREEFTVEKHFNVVVYSDFTTGSTFFIFMESW